MSIKTAINTLTGKNSKNIEEAIKSIELPGAGSSNELKTVVFNLQNHKTYVNGEETDLTGGDLYKLLNKHKIAELLVYDSASANNKSYNQFVRIFSTNVVAGMSGPEGVEMYYAYKKGADSNLSVYRLYLAFKSVTVTADTTPEYIINTAN